MPKQINPFIPFDRTPTCDRQRQTDRHRAARRAGKNVGFQRRAGRRGGEQRAPLTEGVCVGGDCGRTVVAATATAARLDSGGEGERAQPSFIARSRHSYVSRGGTDGERALQTDIGQLGTCRQSRWRRAGL